MHALHVLLLSAACECLSIGVLLLTQPNQYDLSKVLSLQKSVDLQSKHHNISVSVFKSHDSFGPINGHWTIFPLLERLLDEASVRDYGWLIICEPDSDINLLQLKDFLSRQDDNEALFFGYGLRDTSPTIIHHFYGFDSTEQMEYPDFAAGVAVSRVLLARLVDERKRLNSLSTDFAIDVKHEFAKFVFDCCRTRLHSVPDVFCLFPGSNCAIVYHQPTFSENELCKQSEVTVDNVFVAIKTYSGFHRSRVVAVKRTWASKFKFAEFVSDIEDHYIPTITLGVSNTQRGHCAKTLAIIKHYVNQNLINLSLDWLVIADDDTLLSPSRLMRLLRCFNKTEKLIIGERYGYGFSLDGTGGYDYPTGGAGMLFSLSAAQILAKQCSCPNQDSPDDMIIGSCARSFSIPVIHSAAFHQARSIDYSSDYVKRIVPISFHKFEEIDPYKEYMSNLHDEEQAADFRAHAEL